MEVTALYISTLLALLGAIWGGVAVTKGTFTRNGFAVRGTFACMLFAFGLQLLFLKFRGDLRGACPLRDLGEILAFLAWALTVFYLLVGRSYRMSIMGIFTAPVVVVFQVSALMIPGLMDQNPVRGAGVDAWRELHSAVSVVAYGAFALAAVSGLMFLTLNHLLKEHHLRSGLFRNLPPARELLSVVRRLLMIGLLLLTVGLIAGFMMPSSNSAGLHFAAALVVWIFYGLLLGVLQWRGLTGRRLSLLSVVLFLFSLAVFGLV